MSKSYSEETRRILSDFLDTLSKNPELDASFLHELRQMMDDGKLENRTRIREAVQNLEARADEL